MRIFSVYSHSTFYRWGNWCSENWSEFSQCHTAGKRQSWNLNPGSLSPKPKLLVSMLDTLMLATCLQSDDVIKTHCPSQSCSLTGSGRALTIMSRSHYRHVSVFQCFLFLVQCWWNSVLPAFPINREDTKGEAYAVGDLPKRRYDGSGENFTVDVATMSVKATRK